MRKTQGELPFPVLSLSFDPFKFPFTFFFSNFYSAGTLPPVFFLIVPVPTAMLTKL
jgi:hypothetical protein